MPCAIFGAILFASLMFSEQTSLVVLALPDIPRFGLIKPSQTFLLAHLFSASYNWKLKLFLRSQDGATISTVFLACKEDRDIIITSIVWQQARFNT